MVRSRRSAEAGGYLVAVTATAAAVPVRLVLSGVLGDQAPFFPFVLAVLVAAWYGGQKPGLLATALGAALGICLLVRPFHSSWIERSGMALMIIHFLVIGVTASVLCGALHAARCRIEEKQRQLAHTEERVRSVVTQRKRAEEALKEADRHKDEFLAMLAHELRNPLAPLRSALEIVKLEGDSAKAVGEVREMMERQLTQLVRLVDDLLDPARIGRGTIELRNERVSLSAVVQIAVETSRPMIEAEKHQLTITKPHEQLYVTGDPIRLSQVVSNLLNNAAKYTPAGGRIWLTIEQNGGAAVIRVKDSGIGIPAEKLPRVFDLFMQVEPVTVRSRGGLGIGLTLVKQLVELHGGTVEAHSEGPGLGSEFIVRLPLTAVEKQQQVQGIPQEQRTKPAPAGTSRRILVVDDNVDAAKPLSMMLTRLGHEVRTVHDGPSAIELAATFLPDVALLDIGMPGMNGYETGRRLRELPGLQRMFLVALTGWGQDEDRQRTEEAGFAAHFVKPVAITALQELLDSLRAG
jgi:signal transduction histidine kinase